jgi:hypothetical protein
MMKSLHLLIRITVFICLPFVLNAAFAQPPILKWTRQEI